MYFIDTMFLAQLILDTISMYTEHAYICKQNN